MSSGSSTANGNDSSGAGNGNGPLILAIPSKGRLMEATAELFQKSSLALKKTGHARGYRGEITGMPGVEIAFVSAAEITQQLKSGQAHLGVTGEDLVYEAMPDVAERVETLKHLGFGFADVVVAVPDYWIDVATMADLEEAAVIYRRRHGQRLRVATKYTSLTRRFFAGQQISRAPVPGFSLAPSTSTTTATSASTGAQPRTASTPTAAVTQYRIVESHGATEGAPAGGTAELIVDITTTGSTLKANALKILDDGVILKSQATLFASRAAPWSPTLSALRDQIITALTRG